MLNFLKTRRTLIVVTLLVALSFVLGVHVGRNKIPEVEKVVGISNKESPIISDTDFAPFWKAWNVINDKSPNASKLTNQDRVYGAISGLVGSLKDPYSVFLKPDEAKSFEDAVSGNFVGIGIEIGVKDSVLTVIAPLKDTPAYKAGIKSGDKILKIDKTNTSDLSVDEAIKLIKGEKGTTVTLTILSINNKNSREVKVVRDTINIPTLDTELRPDGIFVIKLYSFTSDAPNLFHNAMIAFAKSGSDKMLLDLRGNPGGYLDAAVDIASWFLPEGKPVVTEDYGGNKKAAILRSAGYDIFNDKLKFVILIDGGSASAAEILAGAMQDYKKAKLVGNKSFGKGSVQETVDLTPDTILKITVAKWLTPNGTSISLKGLTPDYVVQNTQQDLENKRDPQMDKAVELLLNK